MKIIRRSCFGGAAEPRRWPVRNVLTVMLVACAGCSSVPPGPEAMVVTIPALLADPATYDGKLVQVRGAAVARFEAEFVCPGVEQIDSGRSQECLWLMPGIGEGYGPGQLGPFHGKWVIMTGRFDTAFKGHGGAYGGAIVPLQVQVVGTHGEGDIPPPPEPPANGAASPGGRLAQARS